MLAGEVNVSFELLHGVPSLTDLLVPQCDGHCDVVCSWLPPFCALSHALGEDLDASKMHSEADTAMAK